MTISPFEREQRTNKTEICSPMSNHASLTNVPRSHVVVQRAVRYLVGVDPLSPPQFGLKEMGTGTQLYASCHIADKIETSQVYKS